MTNQDFLLSLFLSFLAMVKAEETDSCYRIATGTLAGVVFGDVALTILIVSATYYCASKRRIKKEKADKVYMNVRANCKN
ncbi:hypothetical protein KOW79_000379 [Hemibagrus wyckioides]|uniref:Hematopoietic cell signal transducer n=1 Tax=Hemibagrus wyckioides TaxID=337641 RepID=A0A9D3P7W9_9TELE|nr:hematopoietic cell signal transducer [Hemibagrus wyckioides]XP_058274244.1 hematopoietic cell signal transducer [Hemibagrus wyckioides]XP_058274320.1 hematopoietic cell signal transducer [Hemibagrus wyckioides]KAG7335686.1 hypothetical protein KOW79_000379 [Hemibagrus wyckioides]